MTLTLWYQRNCGPVMQYGIINGDMLHGTVRHPTKFQAELTDDSTR